MDFNFYFVLILSLLMLNAFGACGSLSTGLAGGFAPGAGRCAAEASVQFLM
jgi:hypothetical protein